MANSCFWDKRPTAHCCVPLAQLRRKQQNQPKTQWNKRCNYSTTLQPRKKQSSHTAQVTTWNAVHNDASYLSEPQACNRAGSHFFLSNEATIPANNDAMLNFAHIIKHVMTSATGAELATLYIMPWEAAYIRIHNLWHHYKLTTPQRRRCATAKYNLNKPKQGHEIPLVKRQTMPRAIQNILETGQIKLRRLLDKTSSSNPIHNTTHSGGNVKNRTKQNSSHSSSIKCSESEHLRGCDDLAVYGKRTTARPKGKCTLWEASAKDSKYTQCRLIIV